MHVDADALAVQIVIPLQCPLDFAIVSCILAIVAVVFVIREAPLVVIAGIVVHRADAT